MIVEWLFRKMFTGYEFPFETSDLKIMSMKEPERREYYRNVKSLIENPAYIQETQNLVRKYYQELSVKTGTKLEQQAYRLTLIALKEFDTRLKNLATLSASPTISNVHNKL